MPERAKKHSRDIDPYEITQHLPSLSPFVLLYREAGVAMCRTRIVKPGEPHMLRIALPDHPGMGELANRAWDELDRMGKEPVLVFHAALYAPDLGIPAITEFKTQARTHRESWYEARVPFVPRRGRVSQVPLSIDIFLNQFLLVSLEKMLAIQNAEYQE